MSMILVLIDVGIVILAKQFQGVIIELCSKWFFWVYVGQLLDYFYCY